MARARNIKPAFFSNEDLAELPFESRLLFIGLWTLADKAGRLEDRPKKIKFQLFPGDDLCMEALLESLAVGGFIIRYEVEGRGYIQVTNFLKHQNPHHKEQESELPGPEKGSEIKRQSMDDPSTAMDESSTDQASPNEDGSCPPDSLNLIPDSLNSDSPITDSKDLGSTSDDDSPEQLPPCRDFPLKDGSTYHLDEDFVTEIKAAYPKLSIEYELRRSRIWLTGNAGKRKTKAGMKKFLSGWMSRQKPTAVIHQMKPKSRHVGFEENDYSEGLIEGVSDDAANF